jgi:outer membrane protein insertion porin family
LKSLLVVFSIYLALFAQRQTYTIKAITVEGNQRTETSTIRVNSGLYIGKEIGPNDIPIAIKSLWALGQWEDIKIYIANINAQREVDLIIKVKEYPRLSEYEFKGNDELDKDDFDKVITFYRGMVATPYKIFKAKKAIKKLYNSEGYLLTTVKTDTVQLPDNRLKVIFEIKEGPEVQVEKITIFGNKELDAEDIADAMEETSENGFLGFGGTFDEKKYKEDLSLISKYIQNQGYRDGGVIRDSIYYSNNNEEMYINIYVEEGNRYYFGDITFQGNKVFRDYELTESINLIKAEPYSEELFVNARQTMSSLYYNKGYLFNQISPRETIINEDTVNINFVINENKVVRLNEIHITGNTKTQDKVIRRELFVFPGQKFSQEKIQRSMRDLQVLNYFENIVPTPKQIGSDEKIDIEFEVKEKSTDQANASIGYSELDGLIGSVGLTFNNFSLEKPFQEGGGQQVSLNAQFGGVQTVYSAGVTEPWLYGSPTLIGLNIYYSKTRKDGRRAFTSVVPYNEDRQSVQLTLGKRLRWPDNFFRGSMSLQWERSKLTDLDDQFSRTYLAQLEGRAFITYALSATTNRDSRNSAEFPTNGSLYSLSSNYTFGDQNFLKFIASNETYTPVWGKLIFHTKMKFGLIHRYGDTVTLLPNDLFHMGGAGLSFGSEPLRGYEDRSVGSSEILLNNGAGNRSTSLGGDAMFKFVTEMRIQLVPNPTIFGLLFLEGGNVWAKPGDIDIYNLKRSIGFGIRLFMPLVGIIGFDYGYGFDRFDNIFSDKSSPKWEFHFQFGKF